MAPRLYSKQDWLRFVNEDGTANPWRSPVTRDFGRVIHSACFRRLQGKTQVFPTSELDFFRNRLTHSLEVSQIAQGIAERLNYVSPELKEQPIDVKLCGVAGLIHDIGHPPFGHHGERALDQAMLQFGGFEGNAQNLRIVGRLEKKIANQEKLASGVDDRYGLNLTFRTLASMLKYDNEIPMTRPEGADLVKGQYAIEAARINRIKETVLCGCSCEKGQFKTLECWIMDVADDIAYSTYDLEDCLKAGFLSPLGILSSDDVLLDDVAAKTSKSLGRPVSRIEVSARLLDIFIRITEAADGGGSGIEKITQAYKESKLIAESAYTRTQLTAELVNEFINAVELEYDPARPMLSKAVLSAAAALKVEVLKQYTYAATISSARVKLAEYKGTQVVSGIFESLSKKRGHSLMPDDVKRHYQSAPDEASKMRVVCDFVAGMTDRYAMEFYNRLYGTGESMFKPIG